MAVIRLWFKVISFTGVGHLQAVGSYTSFGTGSYLEVLIPLLFGLWVGNFVLRLDEYFQQCFAICLEVAVHQVHQIVWARFQFELS